jgi:restriction system protein
LSHPKNRVTRERAPPVKIASTIVDSGDLEPEWQSELLAVLISMPPDAFESLAMRVLRQSGFLNVTVTGKSGDGGIDGSGVWQVGGLLSFHVHFQCKRYKGTVPPADIRDFRGAITGEATRAYSSLPERLRSKRKRSPAAMVLHPSIWLMARASAIC